MAVGFLAKVGDSTPRIGHTNRVNACLVFLCGIFLFADANDDQRPAVLAAHLEVRWILDRGELDEVNLFATSAVCVPHQDSGVTIKGRVHKALRVQSHTIRVQASLKRRLLAHRCVDIDHHAPLGALRRSASSVQIEGIDLSGLRLLRSIDNLVAGRRRKQAASVVRQLDAVDTLQSDARGGGLLRDAPQRAPFKRVPRIAFVFRPPHAGEVHALAVGREGHVIRLQPLVALEAHARLALVAGHNLIDLMVTSVSDKEMTVSQPAGRGEECGVWQSGGLSVEQHGARLQVDEPLLIHRIESASGVNRGTFD